MNRKETNILNRFSAQTTGRKLRYVAERRETIDCTVKPLNEMHLMLSEGEREIKARIYNCVKSLLLISNQHVNLKCHENQHNS